MKKKMFGAVLGIVAIAIFSFFSSINTIEAQEVIIEGEPPTGPYALIVCFHPGSNPTAECAGPMPDGPCWEQTDPCL